MEAIEHELSPHLAVIYAIAEKSLEALEVHGARWGGSGAGGQTLEDRFGECWSIRTPKLVDGRMNRRGREWLTWRVSGVAKYSFWCGERR